MSPALRELLEFARNHQWTEEEKRDHAISFAYGNLILDGCKVTREQVAAAFDKLHGVTKMTVELIDDNGEVVQTLEITDNSSEIVFGPFERDVTASKITVTFPGYPAFHIDLFSISIPAGAKFVRHTPKL